MSKGVIKLVYILVIICVTSIATYSRDKSSQDNIDKLTKEQYASSVDFVVASSIKWPSHIGYQQTGIINAIFNDEGQIGNGFSRFGGAELDNSSTYIQFETPSSSRHEYLFGGGIWIGAVVGDDTLVSAAVNGWDLGGELGHENYLNPNVKKVWFPSDYSMRTEFADTSMFGTLDDKIAERPHIPLNIKIASRSHVWRNDPLDNAIFYDYIIDYFGPEEQLDSVYIGFFFDCDVGGRYGDASYYMYGDDLSGSMRDNGIVYSIDNNGDPVDGAYDENSATKAFAFELLASSFVPTDTNFNWWVPNEPSFGDFGPRLKGTPEDPFRDFGTGGLGVPAGDANKYYMMSHKEWDYDQIFVSAIERDDPDWMYPMPDFMVGTSSWDTRFLYSIGPITLVKGKPERIIFATFTADSVHNNPDSIRQDYNDFAELLNLESIISVGSSIRQVLDVLLDPLTPPMGLEVYDYNKIKFDPFIFNDVTEHEVYATPVDVAAFPFPGLIPPWYMASSPIHVGSSINEIPLEAIDGLTSINVAYNSSSGISELSGSAYINIPELATPITKPMTITSTQDSVVIDWMLPDSSLTPDHYKIYKFATFSEFYANYRKPYYLENAGDSFTLDSVLVDGTWWFYQAAISPPYATVDGGELKFVDYSVTDSSLYFIIGVDANGFESEYAKTTIYLVPERVIDILIISNSGNLMYTTDADTVMNYYINLLDGTEMSYDIYSVIDSIKDSVCSDFDLCPDWQTMSKYKCVIIDDGEYAEQNWRSEIDEYLINGGKVVTFGAVAKYNNLDLSTLPGWYQGEYEFKSYDLNASLFGIDSVYYAGFAYNFPDPIEDGKFGFNTAISEDNRYPSLECDVSRYPLDSNWLRIVDHPTNEPLSVSAFIPSENSVVTHRYKSLSPSTSYMENMPVGLKHEWSDNFYSYEVYTYGFHLYYMNYDHARDLLRSILSSVPTDISEFDNDYLPSDFKMYQNYPNPFNPTTTIEFSVPKRSLVTLNIYNLLGQKVKEITNREYPVGNYKVTWDGTNNSNNKVSSGIYLYRIELGEFTSTRKMVLLK